VIQLKKEMMFLGSFGRSKDFPEMEVFDKENNPPEVQLPEDCVNS